MYKFFSRLILLAAFIALTTLNSYGGGPMKLSSPAFPDGGKIPLKYVMPGAGGENLSLPLAWSEAPPGTKSFALSLVDPHPVARNWVHWLVLNLPGAASSMPEGASEKMMPGAAVELVNSFGLVGYGGPQPPRGTGDHPYVLTLYALSVDKINLPLKTDLAAFNNALKPHTLATAKITGYFGR
jgi:Raf kinase inhibitor-like YbhB/YbcL family protein